LLDTSLFLLIQPVRKAKQDRLRPLPLEIHPSLLPSWVFYFRRNAKPHFSLCEPLLNGGYRLGITFWQKNWLIIV